MESKVTPASFDLNHNVLSIGTADDALANAFTVGSTHLYGPTVVNSIRLTANRVAAGKFDLAARKDGNIRGILPCIDIAGDLLEGSRIDDGAHEIREIRDITVPTGTPSICAISE